MCDKATKNINEKLQNNCKTCETIKASYSNHDLLSITQVNNNDQDVNIEEDYFKDEFEYCNDLHDNISLSKTLLDEEVSLKSTNYNTTIIRPHLNTAQNKTFSNEKLRDIDRTNTILMNKILSYNRRPSEYRTLQKTVYVNPPSAAVNRRKFQDRISYENQLLLKKIQSVKPSIKRT